MRYAPAVSHSIQASRLGNAVLLIFAIIYAALCVHMALTLGVFSVKILFFSMVGALVWLLCAHALRRQHVGLLRWQLDGRMHKGSNPQAWTNKGWTWEPKVREGALTHHPVVDVTLTARFDAQIGMLLRYELYETNSEGHILGTTVLWLLALHSHAASSAAWQDLRRAAYAPILAPILASTPAPVSSNAGLDGLGAKVASA